jgi:hypothetical protein
LAIAKEAGATILSGPEDRGALEQVLDRDEILLDGVLDVLKHFLLGGPLRPTARYCVQEPGLLISSCWAAPLTSSSAMTPLATFLTGPSIVRL